MQRCIGQNPETLNWDKKKETFQDLTAILPQSGMAANMAQEVHENIEPGQEINDLAGEGEHEAEQSTCTTYRLTSR